MSDIPERDRGSGQAPPWLRALIAIAAIFGLAGVSQVVARTTDANAPGFSTENAQAGPTPTFGAFIQVATRLPTPTFIRVPTRLPDSGTNRSGNMCTVIVSEHEARPNVPMCGQ